MRKSPTAVFIGRFQPLHKGHLHAIKRIAARQSRIIIVIGSAQKKNESQNPYSLSQRKKMLKMELQPLAQQSKAKIRIYPLDDSPSDAKWLDALLQRFPASCTFYSNNPLVHRLLRSQGIVVRRTGSLRRASYQGKVIRGKMAAGKKWDAAVPEKVAEYIKKE